MYIKDKLYVFFLSVTPKYFPDIGGKHTFVCLSHQDSFIFSQLTLLNREYIGYEMGMFE